MNAYLYPVKTALIQFPLIALALTIPYMLYNYHKYGSISKLRSLILFSLILYLQCAYYLVILPLPDPAKVANIKGHTMQLVPFNFIYEFIAKSSFSLNDSTSIIQAMKESYFLQPLFNLILTMPFGIYLSYYFKEDLKKTVLLTFILSLFFELTQLTGLYGVYPRPYRLFDVDDLMINTLGGVVGHFIGTNIFGRILPSRSEIDTANLKQSESVSYMRRFFGYMIDSSIAGIISALVLYLAKTNDSYLITAAVFWIYYIASLLLFKGQTLGKKFVRLKIAKASTDTETEEKAGVKEILIRYIPLSLLSLYFHITNDIITNGDIKYQKYIIISYLIIFIVIFVDIIKSRKSDKRLWYERFSGTKNINLIKEILNNDNECVKI